jgi:peptide deformylase
MILPVFAFGQPVLREKCKPVDTENPDLAQFISDMWQTMYDSNGVGLAAPQVGKNMRIFVADTTQLDDEKKRRTDAPGFKKVFINPEIMEETGKAWDYEEGCLSIPHIRGSVSRLPVLRIRYQNEAFEWCEETYDGMNARVIQHEFDHIEGVLFIDKLNPLKRRMIQRRLDAIKIGNVDVDYKMKFAPQTRR